MTHPLVAGLAGSGLWLAMLLMGAPPLAAADPPAREALRLKLAPYYRPPEEFAGQYGRYKSPLDFAAGGRVTAAKDWPRRRAEILARWHSRLGPWPPLLERPTIARQARVDRDGIAQHRVRVEVGPGGVTAEGYLLIPAGSGPFPAAVVPFYEAETSVGQGAKGRGTHDYGWQLARRGFVTLSIGTPGSFERIGREAAQAMKNLPPDFVYQPLTLLAHVAANCHTALAQLPEVDRTRIGIIGLSYGGKWAMFASCLHEPFACAVWSDPGIVFNERDANCNYWEPWYLGADARVRRTAGVPSAENPRTGLYQRLVEADEDLIDLHALMAPRPVLVSGGVQDPPRNWVALNHLVRVNQLLGLENRAALTARQGHVPTPEALELECAFLEYWLRP